MEFPKGREVLLRVFVGFDSIAEGLYLEARRGEVLKLGQVRTELELPPQRGR